MSRFCTQCGESLADGLAFCTGCGARRGAGQETAKPAIVGDPLTATIGRENSNASESEGAFTPGGVQGMVGGIEEPSGSFFRKPWVLVASVLVVLAASVAGSFTAGRSSIDQEKIRSEGYDSGYDVGMKKGFDDGKTEGYNDGYSDGSSSGYSTGYAAGCREAFRFTDGTYSYITAYDPYSYFDKTPSDYYKSDSIC